MTFSRSARTDRRRRVMREAVAADAGLAVESVRVRKRRSREALLGDDDDVPEQRDPGYSQAVRRACQQRLVQLIPVRSSSLWLVIIGLWLLWGGLIAAHYWLHIRPTTGQPMPVSFLLHLRSTHGIAHWLGCQLWMLTALAALMIFQLRRHKLDDYRAKYRLWAVLAIAALVSSLDVSSSGLFLLGKSVDTWTIREVGYPGWTVVLVSFAALVGVLGLRLCSELKSAPTSVGFWLIGLMSWGGSALLGTELIKSPWSRPVTDLVVGGAWLGGILAVFLSAGIYLRHIYIQAQRRFLMRSHMLQRRKAWKLPKVSWKRRNRDDIDDESFDEEREGQSSKRERLAKRRPIDEDRDEAGGTMEDEAPRRRWLPSFGRTRKVKTDGMEQSEVSGETNRRESGNSEPKRRWLRLPRWKSDPRLGEDYSDLSAEHRARDDGFVEPMTKKSGWFAKREKTPAAEKVEPNTSRYSSATVSSDEGQVSPSAKSKSRWFQRKGSTKPAAEKKPPAPKDPKPAKAKRNWNLWKKSGTTTIQADSTKQTSASQSTGESKPRRSWFGMLDGMKLKPPKVETGGTTPKPIHTSSGSIPSSSQSQRYETKSNSQQSSPDFRPVYDDEDAADDDGYRNLSKAERKRLRRQQQENNRRAA